MSTAVSCDKCDGIFPHHRVIAFDNGSHFCPPCLKEQMIIAWQCRLRHAENKLKKVEAEDLSDLLLHADALRTNNHNLLLDELWKRLSGQVE